MSMAGGIALLVVGAILTFALTGSLRGVDLDVVGVILMLAGALGLLLSLRVRTRFVTWSRSNRPAAREPSGRRRRRAADPRGAPAPRRFGR
jgi:Domain of unknown function (DUF6458)